MSSFTGNFSNFPSYLKCSDVIKIQDGIMFVFYPGLPHIKFFATHFLDHCLCSAHIFGALKSLYHRCCLSHLLTYFSFAVPGSFNLHPGPLKWLSHRCCLSQPPSYPCITVPSSHIAAYACHSGIERLTPFQCYSQFSTAVTYPTYTSYSSTTFTQFFLPCYCLHQPCKFPPRLQLARATHH